MLNRLKEKALENIKLSRDELLEVAAGITAHCRAAALIFAPSLTLKAGAVQKIAAGALNRATIRLMLRPTRYCLSKRFCSPR